MSGQVVAVPAAIDPPHQDPEGRMAALFDAHHARLFRLAKRLVRAPEDPSDFVQETFLRAARALHRAPHGHSSEEAWLVQILMNLCRDAWRRRAVQARAVGRGLAVPTQTASVEGPLVARTMVWQALDALAPRRRAILVLYELEGATIPAIARMLGVAPVTVRWHLMRGRREMARVLGDER